MHENIDHLVFLLLDGIYIQATNNQQQTIKLWNQIGHN